MMGCITKLGLTISQLEPTHGLGNTYIWRYLDSYKALFGLKIESCYCWFLTITDCGDILITKQYFDMLLLLLVFTISLQEISQLLLYLMNYSKVVIPCVHSWYKNWFKTNLFTDLGIIMDFIKSNCDFQRKGLFPLRFVCLLA